MHDDADSIASLERRLGVYRRTLEFLETQRAQLGAFTPPYIWHQFDDTRQEIVRVKDDLRQYGVEVEDRPCDTAIAEGQALAVGAATNTQMLLSVYQRMLVDQVRYLSLAQMSRWSDLSCQLADLYVERALIPLVSAGAAGQRLADLAQPPGARIFLEGPVGSGKTTALHMLALACATRGLGLSSGEPDLLADWQTPLPLPILLNGGEMASALTRANAAPAGEQMPSLAAFWEAIEAWLQYSRLETLVPTIQQSLERGGCLVLIDGMDALPAKASPAGFMIALGRFVARYPDNRYVITCRSFSPDLMAPLASFTRYSLAEFDQAQVEAMIERWYAAIADRVGMLDAEDIAQRRAALQATLLGDQRLMPLTRQPLMLALCILAHAEGHKLADARDLVLRRLADLLFTGWAQTRFGRPAHTGQSLDMARLNTIEQRLALVEPLAFALQARLNPQTEALPQLSYTEIETLSSARLAHLDPEHSRPGEQLVQTLVAWCCDHGLLARVGQHSYTMPNQYVREYLAARVLAGQLDLPNRAYELRHAPQWRETLLHTMRELNHRSTRHIARLVVRMLLRGTAGEPDLPINDLLFAAECLVELGDRSWSDHSLRGEVQKRLQALISMPGPTVAERIHAGLLLGRLEPAHSASQLPALALVEAGAFRLGTADGYDDEGPAQSMMLPAFSIGVSPITNQEYALFLAHNPGHKPPRYWHDPRFNNPACPVVGVTWHEANTYCAWLTSHLARADLLAPGQVVRLPSEFEWEKAASWDAALQIQRRFPWGDEWSSAHANTADGRGSWMTAPVGCYPEGTSPYGLHDCVGNVWEWTASTYASYPGATPTFSETNSYTLRGSSCVSNPTHARCTYRSRLPAQYWRNHLGFRIVIGAPIAG